ncbi:unnamed protein product, partial [Rotaria sp. Silwood1]
MEIQRIIAIGKGLGSIPIHIPTSFTILTPDGTNGILKCLIKGPNNHVIECLLTKIDLNRYEVTYTPDRVGEIRIEIFYDNIPIDKSPFIARSFDVNQIKILNFPSSTIVGSSTYFTIDATNAGAGSLEIAVSRDGKNIPNYVQNEGSPFQCNVFSNEFIFENYEYPAINKRTSFLIKSKLYNFN